MSKNSHTFVWKTTRLGECKNCHLPVRIVYAFIGGINQERTYEYKVHHQWVRKIPPYCMKVKVIS